MNISFISKTLLLGSASPSLKQKLKERFYIDTTRFKRIEKGLEERNLKIMD